MLLNLMALGHCWLKILKNVNNVLNSIMISVDAGTAWCSNRKLSFPATETEKKNRE